MVTLPHVLPNYKTVSYALVVQVKGFCFRKNGAASGSQGDIQISDKREG